VHYNKFLFTSAEAEIRDQILLMNREFTSLEFIEGFSNHARPEYEALIRRYLPRYDRAHAMQIAHREITHTLRNKFGDLAEKVGDCRNPKGGSMSRWRRL
jgi:hypothetical protein